MSWSGWSDPSFVMPPLLHNFSNNALINVKHQGGGWGGGQTQGNLTFSWKPESNSPSPDTYWKSISRPWGNFFYQSKDLIIIDRLERRCLFKPHIVFTATQERQCQKTSSSARRNNGGQDALTQTWWQYMSHVSHCIHRTCSWALSGSSNRAKKICIIISFWM